MKTNFLLLPACLVLGRTKKGFSLRRAFIINGLAWAIVMEIRYDYVIIMNLAGLRWAFIVVSLTDKMRDEDNGFETKWARKSGLSLLAR